MSFHGCHYDKRQLLDWSLIINLSGSPIIIMNGLTIINMFE